MPSLVRLILIIGVLSLFATQLYPGAPKFNNLVIPSMFANPFVSQGGNYTLYPVSDNSSAGPSSAVNNNGVINGCLNGTNPNSNFWGCLVQEDGNISYDTTDNVSRFQFHVFIGTAKGVPTNLPIIYLRITAQCRSYGNLSVPLAIDFMHNGLIFIDVPGLVCNPGDMAESVIFNQFSTPLPLVSDFNAIDIIVNPTTPYTLAISYLQIDFLYGADPPCSSADSLAYIGCILTGFFNFWIKLGVLISNVILWVGAWLGLGVTIFVNFINILIWFYNVPGMPVIPQSILSIFITTWIFTLMWKVIQVLRGMNAGG